MTRHKKKPHRRVKGADGDVYRKNDSEMHRVHSDLLDDGERNRADENEDRDRVYDLVQELVHLFEGWHGTIICKDLLGVDLGTLEGRDKAIKDNLFRTLCPAFVRDAAQILSDMKT